jgi:hypothetical protein
MDSLVLVRCVEEEFSIYLPDDELTEVYTVGNLYNLLLRKLKPTPDCLTSKAFYRIRRAMTAVLGLPRRSIRPATFLDDLLNEKQIREQWSAIAHESGLKLPSLRHTVEWKHSVQMLSAVLSFVITLALTKVLSQFASITLDNYFVFTAFFILGLILFAVIYTMLLKATPFRRSVLPTLSAGELSRAVLSMNGAEFTRETNGAAKLTQDQVWIRLVGVFCDQMAFRPEDVVPSASILVDLGEG